MFVVGKNFLSEQTQSPEIQRSYQCNIKDMKWVPNTGLQYQMDNVALCLVGLQGCFMLDRKPSLPFHYMKSPDPSEIIFRT